MWPFLLIQYFSGLNEAFKADILIINVVFFEPRPGIQHLNLGDVKKLLIDIKPKKAILTHFGMTMLKARPHELARQLSWETGIDVVSATDGMTEIF
ncbi:MAG TPA: hypothetical protein PLU24_04990 [Candidatus Omnitrophota bacterium]|nr:hypothetical protein [Candidatus Omnitrophota bacterium]